MTSEFGNKLSKPPFGRQEMGQVDCLNSEFGFESQENTFSDYADGFETLPMKRMFPASES